MKYQVGDLFLDCRGKEHRLFLITEVIIDGIEPAFYLFYITPDHKEDVWPEAMIDIYRKTKKFIHHPVIN